MTAFESIIVHWGSFKALFKTCFGFDFRTVENIVVVLDAAEIEVDWRHLSNWEGLEDIDILHEMCKLHAIDDEVFAFSRAVL